MWATRVSILDKIMDIGDVGEGGGWWLRSKVWKKSVSLAFVWQLPSEATTVVRNNSRTTQNKLVFLNDEPHAHVEGADTVLPFSGHMGILSP
ncbi:3972_t:CDS:1, partial [Acaulospora colombiana]